MWSAWSAAVAVPCFSHAANARVRAKGHPKKGMRTIVLACITGAVPRTLGITLVNDLPSVQTVICTWGTGN